MRIKLYTILFVSALTTLSCATRRGSGTPLNSQQGQNDAIANMALNKDAEAFWRLADSSSRRFRLISARFTATITDADGKEQSVKGKLKACRDSVIWASLTPFGLEVARLRADKSSFGFIDFFNKKYFSGDYTYLKELAGYDLDFYSLQALVLGVHEFRGDRNSLAPSKSEETWVVSEKGLLRGEMRIPDKKVWFSKENLVPYRMEYSDWKTGDRVESDFQTMQVYNNNVVFPARLVVSVKTEKKKFKADIDFRSIDFEDPETEFYFSIPEGYQPIEIKKQDK